MNVFDKNENASDKSSQSHKYTLPPPINYDIIALY